MVIGTYNRANLLGDTLTALVAQEAPPSLTWEIIVVDNNSQDRTADIVAAFARRAKVPVHYKFEPQQGLGYARNMGVAEAQGATIAFTDDDVLPARDWVAKVASAIHDWGADGVGGRVLPNWEGPVPAWLERNRRLRDHLALMEFEEARLLALPLRGSPKILGCNMAFRRVLFEDIGLFSPALGRMGDKLYLYEETHFIRRALERGRRIVYDPVVTVFHRIGPDRMRKAYFRQRAFEAEEGLALAEGRPPGSQLFGVPRWQYRIVLTELFKWLAHSLSKRRDHFERQLDFLSELGRLSGYLKMQLTHRRRASSEGHV